MKNKYFLLLLTIFMGVLFCAKNTPKAQKIWSTSSGLKVPESIFYNAGKNELYVSNINGNPAEKNGQGFISKMSTEGKILILKWVTGLNAPKGMGLLGNTLYVTDIDRIHEIDITSGKITKTYSVAGALFLNDIAVDANNTVYISDMDTNRVHSISDGQVSDWMDLKPHTNVNGLYMENDQLLVGTAQGLLKIDIKSKKVMMFIPNKGGIDGLRSMGKGMFIISDWAGKIQVIQHGKSGLVLQDTTAQKINAADLEYIKDKKLLLVPTFFHNSVDAYKIK